MSKRFLLADDHAIVRYATRKILEDAFPEVSIQEAADADDLLRQLAGGSFDLAIADINMPGKDIFDVIAEIKKSGNVPVLLFSVNREEVYGARAIRAGAAGFVSKNDAVGTLIKAIEIILNGRKFITPAVAEQLAIVALDEGIAPAHMLLSNREFCILKLLAGGKTLAEIGSELSIGTTTVSTHRTKILEKMKLRNNADIVQYVITHQLLGLACLLLLA